MQRVVWVLCIPVVIFLLWCILKYIFRRNDVMLTKTERVLIGVVMVAAVVIFVQLYLIDFCAVENGAQIYIALATLFSTYLASATLLLIAVGLIVYFLLMRLHKKHELMMENTLLRQQYEFGEKSATDIKQQYDNLQKMRHDYKNMLLVIRGLNANGKQQELDEFIAAYLSGTDSTPTILTTDNAYVNAIVNLKIAQARERGISVTVDMPLNIGFEHPIDLCNLLGNLFDNAIEACALCQEDNRSIQVSLAQRNEQLVLFMKNTVAQSVLKTNPRLLTHKKDKMRHGYGIRIIKETAQKHHGFADFYEEDGFFCCNVVLYK